jgi:hypothetical protein
MALEVTKALRLAFEGKLVLVVLKGIHAYIVEKNEREAIELKGSAVTTGFFLDYDNNFLYLGTDAGEIEEAIALQNIASIRLAPPEEEAFVSFPKDESEIN